CTNYALLGDVNGNTYVNASGASGQIVFRINNSGFGNPGAIVVANNGKVTVGNLNVAGQNALSTANRGGALVVTNTLTSSTGPAVVATTNSDGAAIKGISTPAFGAANDVGI